MIHELRWDSNLLKKKIGELKVSSGSGRQIQAALLKAKAAGFQYIICRIKSQKQNLIQQLELSGFCLSDIGVTWAIKTETFLSLQKDERSFQRYSIKTAGLRDITGLQKLVKSLFLDSRFYNERFFSKKEADYLYQAWIENSVKGDAADIVLFIHDIGFVTCRKTSHRKGDIPLIGIRKDYQGKRIGIILMNKAMDWFKDEGVALVSVRTQMKNLQGMNFYRKSGFYIKGYDLVFSRIL